MLVDVIIVLFLLMGAIVGFKRGLFKSSVMFLGTILVIVLAFYLKNPVSKFLYLHLPFFDLGKGIQVFNILFYEAIAFLVVFLILMSLLKIIIKITGLFELLLKLTVVLGLPSKILGAIFGLLEQYLLIFIILFIGVRVSVTSSLIYESNLAPKILNSSPLLSNIVSDYSNSFNEIYELKNKYDNIEDKNEYNKEALEILLKYQIITPDAADSLVKQQKLSFDGASIIIEKYQGGNEND